MPQHRRVGQPDHRPAAHLGGVDLIALAGLPAIRDLRAPPDGGGFDLRPALRAIYDGRDRRRGPPEIRRIAAVSDLRAKSRRRPPSEIHPTARDGAQGQ